MDKELRQKRIQQKMRHIKRQVSVHKLYVSPSTNNKLTRQPHRLAKRSVVSCGSSTCAMCGNPRKFFSSLTKQEANFFQTEHWVE